MTFKRGQTYELVKQLVIVIDTTPNHVVFHHIMTETVVSFRKSSALRYVETNVLNPCTVDASITDLVPIGFASIVERSKAKLWEYRGDVYFYSNLRSLMVNLSTNSVINLRDHNKIYLEFKCILKPLSLKWEF